MLHTPQLHVAPDADAAGQLAARRIAEVVNASIADFGRARVLFASSPSQSTMLRHLKESPVDWRAVEAFHIDEYIGLEPTDRRGFGAWLADQLFDEVQPGAVHYLRPAEEPEAEIARYTSLLLEAPIDLACIGIGVNGHIAFNEPNQWRLDGGPMVARIMLDDRSRQQQVDDECFDRIDEVPFEALTLTVPALLLARSIVVTAVGTRKAAAIRAAVAPGVTPECPATALQTHDAVDFYLDRLAYGADSNEGRHGLLNRSAEPGW